MALDPEELKRRREQRVAARRQRQARKRRLLLRLGIAAAVLVACGLLIFLVTRKTPSESPAQAQDVQSTAAAQTQAAQTEAIQTEAPPTTTIRLALAGDLNVTDRVVASGGSSYDYTDTFLDVAAKLADADLTVLNLEGNLCGSPYGTASASAPQQMLDALKNAGVDMIQLANSYSIYNGVSGLQSSINSVYAAGMEPLGVYTDEDAYRAGKGYTIREVSGIRIAFVAFTKGMDGMALPEGSRNCVNLLYTDYESTYQKVNTEGITKVLTAARKESPDIIVALLHWGSEFNDTISDSQKKIVSLLRDNGVDVIVGTHSHYVQKMEFDRASGTFLAYSLGDFFGDGKRAGTEYSAIVELEITKEAQTGTTRVSGWDYTPIFTVNEANKPLRVVRLREAIAEYEGDVVDCVSDATYEKMTYALERVEARIAG